jgi:hypothetical protein
MRNAAITLSICLIFLCISALSIAQDEEPTVISALEGQIPEDAVVLFDGSDLNEWTFTDGKPANWDITGGEITIQRGGGIITKREFGDIQFHIEFRTPSPAIGKGQDRGNSGVYFHGAYEVQVLDSYESKTYTNGQCGAIYEQYPPLVNACRPPGVWQTYDIVFRAAKFDADGTLTVNPFITVIHNGILIHDHAEIKGYTRAAINEIDKPTGPIYLQDHNHPVQYRNIWVREL